MKLHTVILAALLTFCFFTAAPYADELEVVLQSDEVKKLERTNEKDFKKLTRSKKRFLPKGSSFDRLFPSKGAPTKAQDVLAWIYSGAANYKTKSVKGKNEGQFYKLNAEFSKKGAGNLELLLIIPHPRYQDSAKYKLLPEIAALQPPQLEAKFSEKIEVQGKEVELYKTGNNICSLFVVLEAWTVLSISQPHCEDFTEIVAFTEKTDFARLGRKLLS